eukprot:1484370-Amphidinium_carterae.1
MKRNGQKPGLVQLTDVPNLWSQDADMLSKCNTTGVECEPFTANRALDRMDLKASMAGTDPQPQMSLK